MSHAIRRGGVCLSALAALLASAGAVAEEEQAAAAKPAGLVATVAAQPVVTRATVSALGVKPLDVKVLATKRGGADVFNDMQLKGVVADNRAVNVTTGGNVISDGAFAGTVGLPLVVQNTGNNVLIQNATIVNVQVK